MTAEPIPTVFIPALLCDEGLYDDVIARLGQHVTAQVLMSPKPTLAESAADILSRAPDRFVLVGTSYGGSLALEIALTAPDRVRALWLMGCDPAAPAAGGPDLVAGLTHTPEAVIDMLTAHVVHPDHTEAAAAFNKMAHAVGATAGAAQATALGARKEVTSRLDNLTMPALILWGADDALVPVAVGKSLADALPHAHFHQFEGCGHLPTLEKPAEAASLFQAFLGDEL